MLGRTDPRARITSRQSPTRLPAHVNCIRIGDPIGDGERTPRHFADPRFSRAQCPLAKLRKVFR